MKEEERRCVIQLVKTVLLFKRLTIKSIVAKTKYLPALFLTYLIRNEQSASSDNQTWSRKQPPSAVLLRVNNHHKLINKFCKQPI